ncbi:MAG: hypothetical protein JXA81_13570, partial [Sedimentisphaerales bacterium]|nr:hypothetical protein [Sedimentisphaerales bacterium]
NKDRFHDSPNGGKWDAIGIMTDGSGSLLDAEAPSDVAYWGIAYYKYIENRSAFNCPSAIRPSDWYEPSEHYLYINSCYGLNGYVCKSRITSFHYPEEMIFCQDHLEHRLEDNGDMLYYDPDDNMNMKQLRVEFDPEYPDAEKEVFRHKYQYGGLSLFDNETGMGYCNTLWLDGHVSEIYGGASDFGLDIPYRWYKPTD